MNIALIVAAGSGKRFGSAGEPKQFQLIEGRPLLAYTLAAFQREEKIGFMVVVCDAAHLQAVEHYKEGFGLGKLRLVVQGGSSRQESVLRGLEALFSCASSDDLVLIHDGARPLVSAALIARALESGQEFGAATAAIAAVDSVYTCTASHLLFDRLDREKLVLVQTPQIFRYALICAAHERAHRAGIQAASDDAELVKMMGHPVSTFPGDRLNFKVTYPEDLECLRSLLKLQKKRGGEDD